MCSGRAIQNYKKFLINPFVCINGVKQISFQKVSLVQYLLQTFTKRKTSKYTSTKQLKHFTLQVKKIYFL